MSCYQTNLFPLSTHCFPVSLNAMRSSLVQGCASRAHCTMRAVFSFGSPHSQVVLPSKYCHFFVCLLHVYPVLSLLRHLQVPQGLLCPVARSSNRLTIPMCTLWSNLFFHLLHQPVFAGFTLVWKDLDFKRVVAGVAKQGVCFLFHLFGPLYSCTYVSFVVRRCNPC